MGVSDEGLEKDLIVVAVQTNADEEAWTSATSHLRLEKFFKLLLKQFPVKLLQVDGPSVHFSEDGQSLVLFFKASRTDARLSALLSDKLSLADDWARESKLALKETVPVRDSIDNYVLGEIYRERRIHRLTPCHLFCVDVL